MDSALILKQKYDSGEIIEFEQAIPFLNRSEILKELLVDFDIDVLNLLNRLTEISEIPFTYHLEKVKNWIKRLVELSYCEEGFSFSGKKDDILSCYNSMTTSILIRMQYNDTDKIQAGINWILKYQNVKRNQENKWDGSRIQKYGGCMKKTPCYIGVVKAMIALSDFTKQTYYKPNTLIEEKLNTGLQYILDHQLYKKNSNGQPITKDILKFTYPFSYKTNIIEILRLLKSHNLHTDSRCDLAKDYIIAKKQKEGYWKINSTYLPKYFLLFDKTKEPGLWISYEIEKLLS